MNKLDIKKKLLMALTIFSMFFGAGNLIFPPFLALERGGNVLSALIGFFITAIGFPLSFLLFYIFQSARCWQSLEQREQVMKW